MGRDVASHCFKMQVFGMQEQKKFLIPEEKNCRIRTTFLESLNAANFQKVFEYCSWWAEGDKTGKKCI